MPTHVPSPLPLVAEALDIAREHAAYCHPKYAGWNRDLNAEMVAIGCPHLSTGMRKDHVRIRLAALAAAWLSLPAGYRK